MLQIFQEIALPHNPTNGGDKLLAIQEQIKDSPFSKEYIPGTGLIVNKVDNPRVVIVSHMDLIPLFNRGFTESKTFAKKVYNEQEYLIGALDNTITNAALIKLIKETDKKDIVFFFSEFEESGFIGMSNFMDLFPEYKSSFFINLDVTNDGTNSYCSVEYDDFNPEKAELTENVLKEICSTEPHIQTYRFLDDMDAILRKGGHGFSYCLPTEGPIHSYENRTKLENLEPYFLGLKELSKIISL